MCILANNFQIIRYHFLIYFTEMNKLSDKIRALLTVLCICFFGSLHAQNGITITPLKSVVSDTLSSPVPNSNHSVVRGGPDQSPLTPEEQGYTRYLIGETVIYRKTVGNLTLEYTPKN
jgi:hypothetical protein